MMAEEDSILDVNELYQLMNKEDVTREEIEEVKRMGIEIGHSGVLERAYELLQTKPTQEELSDALRNAVSFRGYSIHNPQTAVGIFYQTLYGRDFEESFDNLQNQFKEQKLVESELSEEIKLFLNSVPLEEIPKEELIDYNKLPEELKVLLNRDLLRSKGYQIDLLS